MSIETIVSVVPKIPRTKSYIIPVAPIPWARARLAGKRHFNAQSQERFAFGICLKTQHNSEPLFARPIALDITFFMPESANHAKKNKDGMIYHSQRPDLDNLTKFLLDSLKGVLVTDDSIISRIVAKKVYDREPRTEFVIQEI
ncbi:MAG: RusA family crossover junction endodeoxyribonuclease [Candidatus Nitrosopolaris sp.]